MIITVTFVEGNVVEPRDRIVIPNGVSLGLRLDEKGAGEYRVGGPGLAFETWVFR